MKNFLAIVLISGFLMLACVATAERGAMVYNSKTEVKKDAPVQDQAFELAAVTVQEGVMLSVPVIVTAGVMFCYIRKSPKNSALPVNRCNGPPGYT